MHKGKPGAYNLTMATCYKCGEVFPADLIITRSLECVQCSVPVRCCRNCTFYEPGAHWDCRETVPEPVYDKERANFCDYFRLNTRQGGAGGGKDRDADASNRDRFDALFS